MDVAIPLTIQQRRFMLALQARLRSDPDVGPSYDDLQKDLGLKSKSGVSRLVKECVDRGRIAVTPRAARSLVVLKPVAEETGPPSPDLLKTFSDGDLIREVAARGLLSLRPSSS